MASSSCAHVFLRFFRLLFAAVVSSVFLWFPSPAYFHILSWHHTTAAAAALQKSWFPPPPLPPPPPPPPPQRRRRRVIWRKRKKCVYALTQGPQGFVLRMVIVACKLHLISSRFLKKNIFIIVLAFKIDIGFFFRNVLGNYVTLFFLILLCYQDMGGMRRGGVAPICDAPPPPSHISGTARWVFVTFSCDVVHFSFLCTREIVVRRSFFYIERKNQWNLECATKSRRF